MYRVKWDPFFAMAGSLFMDGGSRLDDVEAASLALVSEKRFVAISMAVIPDVGRYPH